jgi:hypothetical protein
MDGKMCPVFTLTADASCGSLEGPAVLASKVELERVLLRICSVSQVARVVATQMLPAATTSATSTQTGASKRKAPDVETIYRCSRCKLRFGTDTNLPKDCTYHPGESISGLPLATDVYVRSSLLMTPTATRRLTTRLNGLISIWTSGPTTMKTAMGSGKILLMSPSIREASFGHAAIKKEMRMAVRCVSMIFGSKERVLDSERH